ncbi:porin family protein, partial [Methylorubrum thiocyanatum]
TLKVEGLYVNLDRGTGGRGAFAVDNQGRTVSVGNPGTVLVSGGQQVRDTEFAVVRAGLNYKFGSY